MGTSLELPEIRVMRLAKYTLSNKVIAKLELYAQACVETDKNATVDIVLETILNSVLDNDDVFTDFMPCGFSTQQNTACLTHPSSPWRFGCVVSVALFVAKLILPSYFHSFYRCSNIQAKKRKERRPSKPIQNDIRDFH